MKCRSEWQRPATVVRIKTSRGPGFCRLTSSITSGLSTSCRTAAFIGFSSFVLSLRRGPSYLSPLGRGKMSLSHLQQFANRGHPDGALAEQVAGDGPLRGIFREPE